jgi:hypothetical protein
LAPDHIDLLVTAAVRWRLLTDHTTAAFGADSVELVVASPAEAGRALQQQHLAGQQRRPLAELQQQPPTALDRLASLGRIPTAPWTALGTYRFRAVDILDPVEVIKACHAYEHLSRHSPGWADSVARRLVRAIVTAATQRLEGYEEAPWIWTRPQVRSGPPIGLARGWTPTLTGVSWVDVEKLTLAWPTASLVVITADAAGDVPAGLPSRGGLIVIAERAPGDSVWEEVMALAPEAVVFWPTCAAWLEEQMRRPDPQFTHFRTPQ